MLDKGKDKTWLPTNNLASIAGNSSRGMVASVPNAAVARPLAITARTASGRSSAATPSAPDAEDRSPLPALSAKGQPSWAANHATLAAAF